MRATSFRKPIPTRRHDFRDLDMQTRLERVSFGFREKRGETIVGVAELRETNADSEAQELICLQEGPDRKSLKTTGLCNL